MRCCIPLVLLGAFVVVGSLKAQGTPGQPMTNEELSEEVQKLREQVKSLSENVTQFGEAVVGNTSRVVEVEQRVDGIEAVIHDQLTAQSQILEQISRTDSDQRHVINLSANMESPEFRRDLSDAVNRSIKREGTVVIENKMGYDQSILVNGADYMISAGTTATVSVPVGTLTTRLPNQQIVNWTISAPNYHQKIDIVPRVTTRRVELGPSVPISDASIYYWPVDPWGYVWP